MGLTELTEDDELAQLLLEAESDDLMTTAPNVVEPPSFGEDLINGSTSSPTASPTKTALPATPSNGFSDRLNRSALAGDDTPSKWYTILVFT